MTSRRQCRPTCAQAADKEPAAGAHPAPPGGRDAWPADGQLPAAARSAASLPIRSSRPVALGRLAPAAIACAGIESGASIVHNHNDEPMFTADGVHAVGPYLAAWRPVLERHPGALL